jgi:hypothetical protein
MVETIKRVIILTHETHFSIRRYGFTGTHNTMFTIGRVEKCGGDLKACTLCPLRSMLLLSCAEVPATSGSRLQETLYGDLPHPSSYFLGAEGREMSTRAGEAALSPCSDTGIGAWGWWHSGPSLTLAV